MSYCPYLQEDRANSAALQLLSTAAERGMDIKSLAHNNFRVSPKWHSRFVSQKVDISGLYQLIVSECQHIQKVQQQGELDMLAFSREHNDSMTALYELENKLISEGKLPPLAAGFRRRYFHQFKHSIRRPDHWWAFSEKIDSAAAWMHQWEQNQLKWPEGLRLKPQVCMSVARTLLMNSIAVYRCSSLSIAASR